MAVGPLTPIIGRTYALGEADYRYGIGPLLVKVKQVIEQTHFGDPSDPWFRVEAVVSVPGMVGAGQERELYIRAAALHTS